MADRKAHHVVLSVGCLKVAQAFSPAPHINGGKMASPLSISDAASSIVRGPFHNLVICVTGLSKDARKQVQEATMRMGGRYSPDLHYQCTHLVVQSFKGRKYDHALKHGLKRGLFVVTLAWFVNCIKQNDRLDESLYSVKSLLSLAAPLHQLSQAMRFPESEHSCLPVRPQYDVKSLSLPMAVQMPSPQGLQKNLIAQGDLFSGFHFHMDMETSNEFQSKIMEAVTKEGGSFIDQWFIGSEATHVLCEGGSILKYLGFNVNLVTPFWVMKSVKERHLQRLVQLSADLARHVSILLEATKQAYNDGQHYCQGNALALCGPVDGKSVELQIQQKEEKAFAAKASVRRRRGSKMQPCRTMPKPITPNALLENLCWSITDLPSAAQFYSGSSGVHDAENGMRERTGFLYDIQEDAEDLPALRSDEDTVYTRPISESERNEIVFKGPFLTLLFPIDRFGEMGPLSKCYYNERGFCRQDILDSIWAFYQECLTAEEVEVALYTDSKHADKLRAAYTSKEASSLGQVSMKRFEFLGSRKSFEGLKRVSRENTGHLYELMLAA